MRVGKIARLPARIRDEVNRRIYDGHSGRTILPWLNSLPEVQDVCSKYFAGREVSPQNLTDWRKGGYHDHPVGHKLDVDIVADLVRDLCRKIDELHTDLSRFATVTATWITARAQNESARRHLLKKETEALFKLYELKANLESKRSK